MKCREMARLDAINALNCMEKLMHRSKIWGHDLRPPLTWVVILFLARLFIHSKCIRRIFLTNLLNFTVDATIQAYFLQWVKVGKLFNLELMWKKRKSTLPKAALNYLFVLALNASLFEPPHDKTNKMACAPSEDSDQHGHPPSLIRVFTFCMKKAWVLSYPFSTKQRLWSDWADAQADPSLRWAHSHFVGFVIRWLICDFVVFHW